MVDIQESGKQERSLYFTFGCEKFDILLGAQSELHLLVRRDLIVSPIVLIERLRWLT